jgi:hypothetical protein
MDSEFTEFSYGFCLTREVIDSAGGGLISAPEFPSLVSEGQPGGGYDVRLDFGVFTYLQFKLSEYMFGEQSGQSDVIGLPYYRFKLMPRWRSLQHDMLLELEATGELAYYVAPQFSLQTEFNAAFQSNQIIQSSLWVPPSAIGGISDFEDHFVVFNDDATFFTSEPHRIKATPGIRALELMKGHSRQSEDVWEIAAKLQQMIGNRDFHGPSLANEKSPAEALKYISYVAHVFYHCEVFFAPSRDTR